MKTILLVIELAILSPCADISGGSSTPIPPKPMAATVCNCGGTKVMCSCEDCKCSITSQPSYAGFLDRVQRGERLTMAVGVDLPGAIRCDDARRFGIADGLYLCWYDGSVPKMQPTGPSVPNVATPRYDPTTRYYQPAWNVQSCPGGNCNRR